MRHIPPPDIDKPPPQPLAQSNAIPVEHLNRIRVGLEKFRHDHGRRLADLGWNRDNLFLGMQPEQAHSYDDLHGMAAILADGAELIHADQERLGFDANGIYLNWFKAGFWLAGPALDEYLKRKGN